MKIPVFPCVTVQGDGIHIIDAKLYWNKYYHGFRVFCDVERSIGLKVMVDHVEFKQSAGGGLWYKI